MLLLARRSFFFQSQTLSLKPSKIPPLNQNQVLHLSQLTQHEGTGDLHNDKPDSSASLRPPSFLFNDPYELQRRDAQQDIEDEQRNLVISEVSQRVCLS